MINIKEKIQQKHIKGLIDENNRIEKIIFKGILPVEDLIKLAQGYKN